MGNGSLAAGAREWEGCRVDSRVDRLFPPWLYLAVLGAGLPTNCLALWAAWRQVRQRHELGVYLLNLSVADLLYLGTLPLWADYFARRDDWAHGAGACKLFGFVFYTNLYVSMAFLCCVSLDRYLAVAHPLRFGRLRRVKTAAAVSALVWAAELGANSAPLFHDELFRGRDNRTFCFERFPLEGWGARLNLYRVFAGFLGPWALMLLCYRGIVRAVRRSVSAERREKLRVQRLALGLLAIVLVCFAPYHALLLARSAAALGRAPRDRDRDAGDGGEGGCGFEERVFAAYHGALALTSLNCVADPILYCLVHEGARGDVARALRHLRRLLGGGEPRDAVAAAAGLDLDLRLDLDAAKGRNRDGGGAPRTLAPPEDQVALKMLPLPLSPPPSPLLQPELQVQAQVQVQ